MRTIRTKVYNFQELNENAKKVSIENYRNNNYEFISDYFIESCIEQAIETGFENISLQYSLNYSQGDGLSFGAKKCTIIEKLLLEILGVGKEKTAKIILNHCSFENTGNIGNHYCYASSNDIRFEFDDFSGCKNNIHKIVGKVESKIQTIYMKLCKDLENQGYEDIECQNSDEYITEILIDNEYEFTKDGNLFLS